MKKIFTFGVGLLFATEAFAQATRPVFPGYGSCPVVNGVVNSTCVADVNRRYAAALDAYNRAANLVTDNYVGTVAPTQPTYSCTKTASGTPDNVCENAYAKQVQNYNIQLSAYQTIQQQQQQLQQEEQAALAARTTSTPSTSGSTTGTLADITQTNRDASKTYQTASTLCTVASVVAAGMFAASCSGAGATCNYKYLYTSIAMAAFAALAGSQAKSHDASALSSCQAMNQLSSTQTNCDSGNGSSSPSSASYTPDDIPTQIKTISQQIDPTTGQCKPSAPATCQTVVAKAQEQGVDTKSLINAGNQFAGSNAPFKVNPDGTITTKDGKTYKASDFADEKSMIAAGIPASEAKALASQLNAPGSPLAEAGIDAKGELKNLPKTDFGAFTAISSDGGSGSGSGSENAASKSALGSKDLNGSGGGAKNRKPSAVGEGLVRNFNGDTIGIANDDIFKMMNKRYKLKTSQDSFIGQ